MSIAAFQHFLRTEVVPIFGIYVNSVTIAYHQTSYPVGTAGTSLG
jgi:hypothetical protein